jgi:thioredoxin reductase
MVQPLMPSEVKRVDATSLLLSVGEKGDKREVTIPNDALIVQVGGTAPSELLQKFGIEVVTKRGEA